MKVGIVMGSDSDLPAMQPAADILTQFGIEFEMRVVSAHRTPEDMIAYGKTAVERGLSVIIAGAGGGSSPWNVGLRNHSSGDRSAGKEPRFKWAGFSA